MALTKTDRDDEIGSDSYERFGECDFLYSKSNQYKIVDLHIFEKQLVENCPLIDLLKFDNKN